jgi:hypothetical protein
LATAVVELAESPSERLLLSVIDTPGFDFRDNKELALERQVSSVLKYVNDLYAETMDEEAKLVRENKGDQHIHLFVSAFHSILATGMLTVFPAVYTSSIHHRSYPCKSNQNRR